MDQIAQKISHEPRHRNVEVVSICPVGQHFQRIVLGGPELGDFTSLSFDDHVKLRGFAVDPAAGRDYTPRSFDRKRNQLTIDFLLHSQGLATEWARSARVGERLVVGGPRGSFVIPADLDWNVLIGDESAYPAIARRMEESPLLRNVTVILHLREREIAGLLESSGRDIVFAQTSQQLVSLASQFVLPPGNGFVWCAGEAGIVSAIRKVFVEQKGLPKTRIRAAVYWKAGALAHHETL